MGIANGVASVSSMWPSIWLRAINSEILTFSQIMYIWAFFSFVSLVLGLIIYPWHNLSIGKNCETLKETKKKDFPLITIGNEFPTLAQNMKNSLAYFKTPMFGLQLLHLPICHFLGN